VVHGAACGWLSAKEQRARAKSSLGRYRSAGPISVRDFSPYAEIVKAPECPPDPETAAGEFVMGRLPASEALSFASHVMGCDRCAVHVGKELTAYMLVNYAAPGKTGPRPLVKSQNPVESRI
jgi:hypothetical protein